MHPRSVHALYKYGQRISNFNQPFVRKKILNSRLQFSISGFLVCSPRLTERFYREVIVDLRLWLMSLPCWSVKGAELGSLSC